MFQGYPFLNGLDTNVCRRPKDGEAVLLGIKKFRSLQLQSSQPLYRIIVYDKGRTTLSYYQEAFG
jgi:hypothetical protein